MVDHVDDEAHSDIDDEECPHGLDPAWCTFCRRKAAGILPGGVRPARPAPATQPRKAPATRRAPASSPGPSPRPASRAPAPRGPADSLVALRKVLFHASAYGAWPLIAESGLFPTSALLAGDPRAQAPRSQSIDVAHPSGQAISVRDQRSMIRANIESHLDGIGLAEWLDILNERVFLFARQKDLLTFMGRYQETEGQDVLVFDTARLMAAAKGRVEVATVSPTEPVPWQRCRCRNRTTFEAIDTFDGDVAEIQEVTVVGGLQNVGDLVTRVTRYHPDRTTEVLLG